MQFIARTGEGMRHPADADAGRSNVSVRVEGNACMKVLAGGRGRVRAGRKRARAALSRCVAEVASTWSSYCEAGTFTIRENKVEKFGSLACHLKSLCSLTKRTLRKNES